MTTQKLTDETETCPARASLKLLSGKWKPEIIRLATVSPLRFGQLMRQIQGISKHSLAVALRELEESGLLEKIVIREKPLHIEYYLTEKGKSVITIFEQLEQIS